MDKYTFYVLYVDGLFVDSGTRKSKMIARAKIVEAEISIVVDKEVWHRGCLSESESETVHTVIIEKS